MAKYGRSVADLLRLDEDVFMRMTERELRSAVKQMSDTANKRLHARTEGGASTRATRRVAKSGSQFSTKGLTLNQLRSEYTRVRNFLSDETSTARGQKEFVSEARGRLQNMGVSISEANFQRFSEIYDELRDRDPSVMNRSMRYKVLKDIAKMVEAGSLNNDQIIGGMEKRVARLYEKEEATRRREVSDFFDI